MEKKRLTFYVLAIMLIVVFSMYRFNDTNKQLYGNDKASIVKVINSINGYEDQPIDILGMRDFNNVRVVGFLYGGSPASIEFTKNEKGNYKWTDIGVKQNETLSSFLPDLPNHKESKLMYIAGPENKVAKMKVDVNAHTVVQRFTPNKAAVYWVDLPQADGGYTFRNYRFYDANGNIIPGISD